MHFRGSRRLAGADQDLKDAEEIARRDEPNGGAMRLFLTDIALERCRLCLAQIERAEGSDPAGLTPSRPAQGWFAWFRRKAAPADDHSKGELPWGQTLRV